MSGKEPEGSSCLVVYFAMIFTTIRQWFVLDHFVHLWRRWQLPQIARACLVIFSLRSGPLPAPALLQAPGVLSLPPPRHFPVKPKKGSGDYSRMSSSMRSAASTRLQVNCTSTTSRCIASACAGFFCRWIDSCIEPLVLICIRHRLA